MRFEAVSFTARGAALGARIPRVLPEYDWKLRYRGTEKLPEEIAAAVAPYDGSLAEICREAFRDRTPLLFIGAAGIAVRSIAPFVRDKLQDPPVLVLDEQGRYVIPLLSGHIGGANELALTIAESTGAEPVITTATDRNERFAVDLWAKEQDLRIVNRDGIAKVSVKALSGKPVTLSIKNYPPAEPVDVLVTEDPAMSSYGTILLSPKPVVLGIGCRKGKSFAELLDFAERCLASCGLTSAEIGAIASIDCKAEEPGLRQLSEYWRVPFLTFDPELLAKAPGIFRDSEFVASKVGVGNVCERAAVLGAGPGAELILPKQAGNGMTAAVARRREGGAK